MATLTEAAYYSRKYIKLGIIAFIAFIILRLLFGAFLGYLRTAFPHQIKPNNAYGKLPAITFPKSASPSAEITFTLQTISGTVPEASTAARVFFMPKERINLLSLSRGQSFVEGLGFTTSPRQLSDTLYRWIDIQSPLRTIELDVVDYQFTMSYLFEHDLTLFNEKNIPNQQVAIKETLEMFKKARITATDIDTINPRIQYLKLVGNELEPTTSQSQADAVRLDFFRRNYDRTPMLTDKPGEGNVQVIMSGSKDQNKRFLYIKNNYWRTEPNSPAYYKLKTSETAWREFLDGKAYIAQLPKDNRTNIPITDMTLAYYDTSASQLFLQPIFVIHGDGDFVAYVPAIAPPWTD